MSNTSNWSVLDPDKLAHELSQRGLAWADANAAASALEETKASMFSMIAAEHLSKGESAAKAEIFAKADERYRKHLDLMVVARHAADRARVRFDTWKSHIELLRGLEASRRAEAKLV